MWPQLLLAHIIPAVAPGVPAEAVLKGVCISWGYNGTHLSYGCIVLAVQAAKPETKPLHCLELPRTKIKGSGWVTWWGGCDCWNPRRCKIFYLMSSSSTLPHAKTSFELWTL
jgi:hypothetical protein